MLLGSCGHFGWRHDSSRLSSSVVLGRALKCSRVIIAAIILAVTLPSHGQQATGATFDDATAILGPLLPQKSYGTTWSDQDGDGWPDLFLNNHNGAAPYVLRNLAGLAFENVSASSTLSQKIDHHSCKWSDYDRDLDWDLYCSTGDNGDKGRMRLHRNRGDGTFDEIAAQAEVDFVGGRGRTVTWLDFDGDGDLDLFVGTLTEATSEPISHFFRNDGAVFANVTASSGVVLNGWAKISIPIDVDSDDDTDLLVAFAAKRGVTTPCGNCLVFLINDGSGRFEVINGASRGLSGQYHQTVATGDFDNDGDLDVFQGTAAPSARFHRNNGDFTFTELSLAEIGMSAMDDFPIVDAHWADFDNDGHLDLYAVRQHQDEVSNAPDILYLNNGDGSFTDGTAQFSASGTGTGRGDAAAIADFDKNGFLDLVIANGYQQAVGPYQLLRNRGNANGWLRIVVTDVNGSPEFGSKVWVTAGGITQFREYGDTGGNAASHEHVLHFGLRSHETVDLVRVRWPDGSVTEQTGIAGKQEIEIRKPDPELEFVSVPDLVGMHQDTAASVIQSANLLVGSVIAIADAAVPAGHVISQLPLANSSVTPGANVSLVISTGVLP